MFDLIVTRLALNPWWFGGIVVLLLLMMLVFFLSFFRNAKQLIWFYMAALFTGVFYAFVLQWFPVFLEALVSYRSDWSLVFLLQNPSVSSVLSLIVFFFLVYALMGIIMILLLELWALLTFRWQRMKTLFERALSESWFVLLLSVFTTALLMVWFTAFGKIDFLIIHRLFAIFSFVFLLQFVVRMIDNAYLHTPKIFMEYVFSLTIVLVFARFIVEGIASLSDTALLVKVLFFQHVFLFFLSILLAGFLASFFVRALFASTYFLEQHHRKTSVLVSWTSRLLLSSRDRHYSHYRIVMGILLSLVMGFVFEMFAYHEWYLTMIPAFFLSYFALFFVLDRQDDMRVRGDLVDKRIESEVRKVFFS